MEYGFETRAGKDPAAAVSTVGDVVTPLYLSPTHEADTRAVLEDLAVCNLAVSLGGVESFVEHTASMSASNLTRNSAGRPAYPVARPRVRRRRGPVA